MRLLASFLKAAGYSVWWDDYLKAGIDFGETISSSISDGADSPWGIEVIAYGLNEAVASVEQNLLPTFHVLQWPVHTPLAQGEVKRSVGPDSPDLLSGVID